LSDRPPNRTYDDDEVREIFSLAAESPGSAPPTETAGSGLTLPELQEVGREVGLEPERVARAAALLDAGSEPVPRETALGVPVRVGRDVELPRPLTDHEWEIVAAELRDTFDSGGRVVSRGSTREWSDGEVHAWLEPTPTGHRLRLAARSQPVTALTVAGLFGLFAGLLLLLTSGLDATTFGSTWELLLPALLALVGGGAAGMNVLRLRRWADDRERRMAHVAERARALAEGTPPDEPA
jgi:hypothetical protein